MQRSFEIRIRCGGQLRQRSESGLSIAEVIGPNVECNTFKANDMKNKKDETRCVDCNALLYYNDEGRDVLLKCPHDEDCGEDGDF